MGQKCGADSMCRPVAPGSSEELARDILTWTVAGSRLWTSLKGLGV